MASQFNSRFGWRWLFVLFGFATWVSAGCSPQMLSMMVMPFTDNNIPPEYHLFKQEKEISFAVVSSFANAQLHPDLIGADDELGDQVTSAFRNRCQKNGHKIKLIPSAQVRSEVLKQRQADGVVRPVEIGKALKADYVLEITVHSFGIYEKNHQPPMYRGNTNLGVNLHKVEVKDNEDHKLFGKEYPRIYPATTGPILADGTSSSFFRTRFLTAVANDISKMFLAYPPEERRAVE
jgi:hypothetical protein